jgi:hypothetical protein
VEITPPRGIINTFIRRFLRMNALPKPVQLYIRKGEMEGKSAVGAKETHEKD